MTPGELEIPLKSPYIPMKDVDFDICYYLSIFPEGFECNTCSIISDQIIECVNCHQLVCKECAANFTGFKNKSIENDNFCCTVCPYYGVMLNQNKILEDIFKILKF